MLSGDSLLLRELQERTLRVLAHSRWLALALGPTRHPRFSSQLAIPHQAGLKPFSPITPRAIIPTQAALAAPKGSP